MLITILLMITACTKNFDLKSFKSKELISNTLLELLNKDNLDEEIRKKLYEEIKKVENLNQLYDKEDRDIFMIILSSKTTNNNKIDLFFNMLRKIALKEASIRGSILFSFKEKLECKKLSLEELVKILDDIFKIFKLIDLERKDINKQTLIFYALSSGIEEIIDFLIDKVSLEELDKDRVNCLLYCIAARQNVFEYLIKKEHIKRFKLNYLKGMQLRTSPLALAADVGRIEIVKKLLKEGANADSTDEQKNKAIILAAYRGNLKIVDLLIAARAKYLTGDEIRNRKAKDETVKIASQLAQLAIDGAVRQAAGAKFGPNIVGIIDSFRPKHDIDRTKCYKIINKRFKKGKWLNYLNGKNISIKELKKFSHLIKKIKDFIEKDAIKVAGSRSTKEEKNTQSYKGIMHNLKHKVKEISNIDKENLELFRKINEDIKELDDKHEEFNGIIKRIEKNYEAEFISKIEEFKKRHGGNVNNLIKNKAKAILNNLNPRAHHKLKEEDEFIEIPEVQNFITDVQEFLELKKSFEKESKEIEKKISIFLSPLNI